MNESDYQRLQETGWRRKLTAEEERGLQTYLAAHPEAQMEWEEEAALNQFLAQVSDAPVASNFTSRVLQAVELDAASAERQAKKVNWQRWFTRWVPRVALASLVVSLSVLGYHRHQMNAREELFQDWDNFSKLTFSNADMWQDFEAIKRLSAATPVADDELFAALK